ncbi:hypothetical protein PM082_000291 [Marasmius tenuissimus]|nr:hypothetical protein PM082_000291 [Marasmius tenuissimus]
MATLGDADYCRCEECREWEYYSEESEDEEPWRNTNPVKEYTKDDSRVKAWSLQTEDSSEGCEADSILEQYSLEATRPFEEVLERLGEAMRRRLDQLKLIQDGNRAPQLKRRG